MPPIPPEPGSGSGHGKETGVAESGELGCLQDRKKAVWLGTVEAPDKQAAVLKAAQEFKTEVWRLYGGGDSAEGAKSPGRIEGTCPAADTAGMAKQPEPPKPASCDISQ